MQSGQFNKPRYAAAKSLEARVWELLGENDAKRAIASCEQLNHEYPEFAPGWHTASHLALQLNNPTMALAAIERAVALDPANSAWLLQQALCLSKLGRIDQVTSLTRELSSRKMKTAYECSSLAMLLTQLGQREEAVKHYEKAVALKPDEAKHYYNIACLQRSLGEIEAAEQNFDKTIELNPEDYEAYKIRSELRKQTLQNNHTESLEQLLASDIENKRGKVQICYAIAKELEDLGEAERSFGYLKQGSEVRRSLMRYDVQRDLDTMLSIQQTFNAELFKETVYGNGNAEAIFILGLPRTGTTLVERILSSHSEVFAAGELSNFAVQMMGLINPGIDDRKIARDEVVELSADLDFEKLGEAYIDSTRPFTGHSERFIDKLPLNFLYTGLIHLALPNAKIINLKRHPLDTCYAIYKQLFIDAYPFSYDLDELGRYYLAYDKLMEHWRTVLPGVIYTVEYEKLVGDIESQSRQLLSFCELDWQPQCLKFYENREASTTASTVQVRQPVYQSSVGKWQQYQAELAPLVKVLNDGGIPMND